MAPPAPPVADEVWITTFSPGSRPLTIWVELSPSRPVVTRRVCCSPSWSTVTVEPPGPGEIAWLGTLIAPSTCSTTTSAEAVIPVLRRSSICFNVTVTGYSTTLPLDSDNTPIAVTFAASLTSDSALTETVAA